MISRQMHGRIAWVTGVALVCATALVAQDTPAAQPNGQTGTQSSTATQSSMGPASSTNAQGRSGDQHFVKEATQGSNAEIALGKLAQEKSSSQDVKDFGQRMVTDHSKLNDQMAPVAQQMGITASPDEISPKDQALQKKLQALSGDQFDQAYIKAMVKDHTKDVKMFQRELSKTQDPTLKQNVQQGLEVIQQHLTLAQQLAQAHNVKKGGASSSGSAQ